MQQTDYNVSINDYIRVIKSYKTIIVSFFCITVFIVTVGSFLMKPVYRATVTLLVDLESPNILTTSGSVELSSTNYYAYKEYFQSQKEIIKSRSIIKQVMDELDIYQMKQYKNAKDPIKKFLKIIKVDPVRDTRLLLLHVDNNDPKLAMNIANRIANIYVMRNLAYISKSEELNLLKNEYLKLQAQLTEYEKVYKHKHPKMIRLKDNIAQMAYTIKLEKERISSYDTNKPGLSQESSEITTSALAALKANNITIQSYAETPIVPIKPKKRLNILISMFVGLFGGIGLAFLFEYLDDTIKNSDDIQRVVEWPILCSVPENNNPDNGSEHDIITHLSPKDPLSEVYRSLRTSILFSSTEEHPVKSIMITSPGPQEGKSSSACNLAIAMAQQQKKALLVDADMRKSRLHNVFKKSNKVGLSSFLSGQAELKKTIQETNINDLYLVSGGPMPPNPSELLASHKLEELIKVAKNDFDFIIFDTPPIAIVTDATIVSQVVDGTIVVVQFGKTIRRALSRTSQILKDAGAKVIGLVFNRITTVHSDYSYYAAYYGDKDSIT